MKLKPLLAVLFVTATALPASAMAAKWECYVRLQNGQPLSRDIEAPTARHAEYAYLEFLEKLEAQGIINLDGAGITCKAPLVA